jgi:mannose-1-phosphate guanylyltransferase
MKAFLLAGGLAERLKPLSDRIPKCLVPIDGVPLLAIWLELCDRYGVSDVLINVSRHADLVEEFVRSSPSRVNVTIVRESAPRGNAGTVLANRQFVDGQESFYILYTDNLTDVALDKLKMFHETHSARITVGLFHTLAPKASGIVQLGPGGRITAFDEKPQQPIGDLASAGIYVARHALFDSIPTGQPVVDFGHDVLPGLVNQMYGCLVDGYLLDIGTPAALEMGSRRWADRKASTQERRP